MEKSSLRNHHHSLKDHSNIIKYSTDPAYCSWVSNKSNCSNDQSADSSEDHLVGGFLWPPRSYTCTFCKREFRSAQALGGHMNVHRRDRARLRQIPSSQSFSASNYTLLNLNLHPNPNPNFSPFSSFSSPPPPPPTTTTTMLPPLISSSPSSALCPTGGGNLTMMKSQIPASIGVCKLDGLSSENDGTIVNKSEIVRLKLEIGLLGESRSDDLDLELRLSCS